MRLQRILFGTALAVGVAFAAGSVDAKILVDKTAEQKQRKDMQKRANKNTLCTAKALLKCEDNGAVVGQECNAANPGSSTVPDPNNKIVPKLVADIAKCESKIDFTKKSATGNSANDYIGIGCPGDSVPGGSDQPFADLAAYQAAVGTATRAQLDILAGILSAICSDNQCTVDQGNRGLAYAKGLLKCISKCENDYKNKKGNGGDNDSLTACTVAGGDANFDTCSGAALTKAQKKGPLDGTLRNAIESAIADASHDLYNEDDCP